MTTDFSWLFDLLLVFPAFLFGLGGWIVSLFSWLLAAPAILLGFIGGLLA